MRLGRVVAHCTPAEKSAKELAELMISAELGTHTARPTFDGAAKPRLVLNRLSIRSTQQFGPISKQIDLSVASGEILGIAGIAGNGQSELMDALSGEVPSGKPEAITLDGVAVGHMGPQERRRLGGCFVPEERNGHGAVTNMTLAENGFPIGPRTRFSVTLWHRKHTRTAECRQRHHQAVRRADHRSEGRGTVAVRRQPAEIPGGTGSRSRTRRCW